MIAVRRRSAKKACWSGARHSSAPPEPREQRRTSSDAIPRPHHHAPCGCRAPRGHTSGRNKALAHEKIAGGAAPDPPTDRVPRMRALCSARLRLWSQSAGVTRARHTCCPRSHPSRAAATHKPGTALLPGRQPSGLSASHGMRDASFRPHLRLEASDAHEEAPRGSRL